MTTRDLFNIVAELLGEASILDTISPGVCMYICISVVFTFEHYDTSVAQEATGHEVMLEKDGAAD